VVTYISKGLIAFNFMANRARDSDKAIFEIERVLFQQTSHPVSFAFSSFDGVCLEVAEFN